MLVSHTYILTVLVLESRKDFFFFNNYLAVILHTKEPVRQAFFLFCMEYIIFISAAKFIRDTQAASLSVEEN